MTAVQVEILLYRSSRRFYVRAGVLQRIGRSPTAALNACAASGSPRPVRFFRNAIDSSRESCWTAIGSAVPRHAGLRDVIRT